MASRQRRCSLRRLSTSFLLLVVLPFPVTQAFVRESPLLWEKTNIPVLSGFYTYKHKVVLADPCGKLDALDLPYELGLQHKEELSTWCRMRLKLEFWTPLSTICSKKESVLLQKQRERKARVDIASLPESERQKIFADVSRSRPKRFPIMIAVGGVIAITVFAAVTFSIATFAAVKARANEAAIEQHTSQIRVLREENLKHKQALEIVTSDLINITMRLQQVETRLDTVTLSLPRFSTTIVDVGSRLSEIKEDIADIVSDWHYGRLSPRFFSLFNMTSHLMPMSLTDLAEADSCSIIESEGFLTFSYYVPVQKASSKIMKANPFVLYRNFTLPQTNKTAQCKFEYDGPAYTLLADGCVNTLDRSDVPSGRKAYQFARTKPCLEPPSAVDPMFKPTDCDTKFTPIMQMRFSKSKTYLYCPSTPISYDHYNTTCPDYPFSLSRSTGFILGDFRYDNKARVLEQVNVSLIDNAIVGSVVYPAAGLEDLGLLPGLKNLLEELDKPEAGTTNWTIPAIGSSTVSAFLAGVGAVGAVIAFKRWTRKRQRELNQPEEVLELRGRTVVIPDD